MIALFPILELLLYQENLILWLITPTFLYNT
jgi:hypothetical protein